MGKVFIFIDNSNIFIQGTKAVAELEDAGSWDQQRSSRQLPNARIDYGCLLQTILKQRELGGKPLLVGSRPPPNDSLWTEIEKRGLDVRVFDRNAANKEKGVDTTIVAEVMETLYESGAAGDTIALVAGDGDYSPLIDKINKRGMSLEVYFWRRGVSSLFSSILVPLDSIYKTFMFATGTDCTEGRVKLEVSAPDNVDMKKEPVLQTIILRIGDIFGWWHRVQDNTLRFYFRIMQDMQRAETWFEQTHPEWKVKHEL